MADLLGTALFFALWLLLSGKFDAFHMGIGLACAFGVARVSGLFRGGPQGSPAFWGRFAAYAPWLAWKILLANLHTASLVAKPEGLSPFLLRTRTRLRSDAAKALYATSITLTPGTVTCGVSGDELLVHALDEASAGDVENGSLERMAGWVYGEGPFS